jgi:hypothetical protein
MPTDSEEGLVERSWLCLRDQVRTGEIPRASTSLEALTLVDPIWRELPHDLLLELIEYAAGRKKTSADPDEKNEAERTLIAATYLHLFEGTQRQTA